MKSMRILFIALCLALAVGARAEAAAPADANAIVMASLDAMGGKSKLLAVRSAVVTAVGTRAMVEQSERPTGPYFIDHYRYTESVDLSDVRVRTERSDWGYAGPQWWLAQINPLENTVLVDRGVSASKLLP